MEKRHMKYFLKRFPLSIFTELSFSTNSSNVESLSSYMIPEQCSCLQLILLFFIAMWLIQTK